MYSFLYLLVMPVVDAFLYGFCYETKIKQYNLQTGFFGFKIFDAIYKLLETTIKWLFEGGERRYRVFQKVIEILGLAIVYIASQSLLQVGVLLVAHYLQTFDFLYYVILNQHTYLESNAHLTKWYGVNGLYHALFKKFDPMFFIIMGSIGMFLVILIV